MYINPKKKKPATEAQMRDMLTRVRDLLCNYYNCPFCEEADFDLKTGEIKNGRHEDWCVYEQLMEMVL